MPSTPQHGCSANETRGLFAEVLQAADATPPGLSRRRWDRWPWVRIPLYGQAEPLDLATAVCLYASARAQRER